MYAYLDDCVVMGACTEATPTNVKRGKIVLQIVCRRATLRHPPCPQWPQLHSHIRTHFHLSLSSISYSPFEFCAQFSGSYE